MLTLKIAGGQNGILEGTLKPIRSLLNLFKSPAKPFVKPLLNRGSTINSPCFKPLFPDAEGAPQKIGRGIHPGFP